MTSDQLISIVGRANYKVEIYSALIETFRWYNINTPLRQCHFLAQVIHESGTFRYTSEIWGPTPAQKRYDTREDLGNTPERDGDGYKYRGRGWIQLTGKANYAAAAKAFQQPFVGKPEMVALYPWAALISGWFWNNRSLNRYADQDDIRKITERINGGFNGFADRQAWLEKCKRVLMP